ncbi:12581_t:CDS:2 [Entrophospora sp. SA101]|nr:12581_t:CDS:2 [Entrophospora sp. SA101]
MFVFSLTKSFKRLPTGSSCISNTLGNGCVARYTMQVNREKIFFNRKRELVKFKEAFSSDPQLHVVLGPPSSGKTALVREVTSKGNFNPLFIDCRKGQFNTPKTIYDSISSQFQPFFKTHTKYLTKMLQQGEISAVMDDLQLKFKPFNENEKDITSDDVIKLLDNIASALPKWTCWDGYNIPPPILIIDEANKFSHLGGSKDGEVLLESILDWLVVNTKQENRFHAVLTSSDSFFLNWIVNFLHVPHVAPYVVGDLSRKEAEEYFEMHILPRHECEELRGKFDRVCKITGTRMLIIDKFVNEYKIYRGKLEDSEFSIFRLEDDKLKRGLYPKSLKFSNKPSPPAWNDRHLIKTMEAIVKAEDQGFILEEDLIKAIGDEQVYSLVDYNYLHRRPTNQYANDIIDPPDEVNSEALDSHIVETVQDNFEEESSQLEHLIDKLPFDDPIMAIDYITIDNEVVEEETVMEDEEIIATVTLTSNNDNSSHTNNNSTSTNGGGGFVPSIIAEIASLVVIISGILVAFFYILKRRKSKAGKIIEMPSSSDYNKLRNY